MLLFFFWEDKMKISDKPVCGKVVNISGNGNIVHMVLDSGEHFILNMEADVVDSHLSKISFKINSVFCFIGSFGKITKIFEKI